MPARSKLILRSPIDNHPPQKQVFQCKARFIVLGAGRRFGKTFGEGEKLVSECEKRRNDFLYTAPTRGQAKQIMWEHLKDRFRALGWKYSKNETDLKITRTLTQSAIHLKSCERPDTMRGMAWNGFMGDEWQDCDHKVFTEIIRPALSDRRGWAQFTFTPKGFNHCFDLYNYGLCNPDWASFKFKTIDSPFFQTPEGRAELESARRDLDEKTYRQEYEASFETFSGRICYAFDRLTHNTDYEYDPSLPIYVGQDFNRTPMSSCLFQNVGGKSILFDELKVSTSSTDEICRILKQKYPRAINIGFIMRPDATGKRKTSNASKSDFEIIREHGITIDVRDSNPSRVDRWAACNRAFERSLLFVNVKNCPHTVKDLEQVIYKPGTCEPDNSDPLAGHLFDAFGYHVYKQFPIIEAKQPTIRKYA